MFFKKIPPFFSKLDASLGTLINSLFSLEFLTPDLERRYAQIFCYKEITKIKLPFLSKLRVPSRLPPLPQSALARGLKILHEMALYVRRRYDVFLSQHLLFSFPCTVSALIYSCVFPDQFYFVRLFYRKICK